MLNRSLFRMFLATSLAAALLGSLGASDPALAAAELVESPADAAMLDGSTPSVAVGPQYDTTHVYVKTEELDAFVNSIIATFGGNASQRAVFTVTPTPSKTASQHIQTPAGMLSVFGFQAPIPIRSARSARAISSLIWIRR